MTADENAFLRAYAALVRTYRMKITTDVYEEAVVREDLDDDAIDHHLHTLGIAAPCP